MNFRRQHILWIALGAFAVVLGVASIVPNERRWFLADGSVLTLQSVEVGTNPVHRAGNRFQRWASYLPRAVATSLGAKGLNSFGSGARTNIAFTFRYQGTKSQRPGTLSWQSFLFRVRDDDGAEANPNFHPNVVSTGSNAASLFFFTARFPEASREFVLVAYDNRPREPVLVGELRLPNPLFRGPARPVPPLPVIQSVPELSVALTEARMGGDQGWRDLDGRVPTHSVARFRLEIRTPKNQLSNDSAEPGTGASATSPDPEKALSDEWAVAEVRCGDAALAERIQWRFTEKHPKPGHFEIAGEWPLWPGRAPLALKIGWIRKTSSAPDRRVALRSVMLASPLVSGGGVGGAPVVAVRGGAVTNFPFGSLQVFAHRVSGISSEQMLSVGLWGNPGAGAMEDRFAPYVWSAKRSEESPRADGPDSDFLRIGAASFLLPNGGVPPSIDLTIHFNPIIWTEFVVAPDLVGTNVVR